MSDEKVIKVTASVPLIAEFKVKELNTEINTPTLVADLNEVDTLGIVVQKESSFRVELSGYGEEVIPEPILFKFNQHLIQALDQFSTESKKAFSDNLNLTDYFTKLFAKLFEETATTSDTVSRIADFKRTFTEGPYATADYVLNSEGYYNYTRGLFAQDRFAVLLAKPLYDYSNISDEFAKHVAKPFTDGFYSNDIAEKWIQPAYIETSTFSDVDSKSIAKGLVETSTLSEQISKLIQSALLDTSTATEQIVFDIKPVLLDTILTTDDVLGEANIDDDQYAFFEKVLRDVVPVSDLFVTTISWLRYFDDFNVINDTVSNLVESTKLDTAQASDVSSNITQKVIIDTSYFTEHFVLPDYVASLYAADQLSHDLGKVFTELNITVEDFVRIVDYNRLVEELVSIPDQVATLVNKALLDTSVMSDLLSYSLGIAKIDSSTATDSIAISSERPLTDNVSNSDVNNFLIAPAYIESVPASDVASLLVSPEYRETFTNSDTVALSPTKGVEDTSTNSDQLAFDVYSVLADIVVTTDDVLGEANVDDDQYAFFEKVVKDDTTTSDSISFAITFYRTFLDSVQNTDLILYTLAKGLVDSINLGDVLSFEGFKVLADNGSISDEISRQVSVVFIEQTYFSQENYVQPDFVAGSTNLADQIAFSASKVLSSATSIGNDVISFVPIKGIEDLATVSEQITYDFTYNLSDIVQTTDDFYGNANIDDDQTAQVGKGLLDTSTLSDLFSSATSYNRSVDESVATNDVNSFLNAKSIVETVTGIENIAISASKNLSEIAIASDTYLQAFTKALSETATFSEYRWANKQDYLSSTYVQTGFVGSNYTI